MNPLKSLTNYLFGVQTELKKVVWPTWPTLLQHFFSVVIGLALATLFVGLVDYVFIHLLVYIIK